MKNEANFDVVLLCDNKKHAGLKSLLSWAADDSRAKLTNRNTCLTYRI